MKEQFGIPCHNICHILGELNMSLENISPKWHRGYNKYEFLEDEDELTELYLNWYLLEKCVPYYCQEKIGLSYFSGHHQDIYQYKCYQTKNIQWWKIKFFENTIW